MGKDGIKQKAFRQAYCQATNIPVPFRDLVYSLREWTVKASENYLTYSNYNTAIWTCDAVDEGLISIGPFADSNLVSWSIGDIATENGVQTWSGSGTARTTSGIDMTGWTRACFAVEFGAYQRSPIRTFTVVLGVCDQDGTNQTPLKTWNVSGSNKLWATALTSAFVPPVTQSAVCFYLTVTCDATAKWFFCAAQAERDKEAYGPYRKTAGSSVLYAVDTFKRGVAKINYREYEELRHPQDAVVQPREGTDPSVHGTPSEVEL